MKTTGYAHHIPTTPVKASDIRKGDYASDPLLVGNVVLICCIDPLIRIETDSTCNNVMYFDPTETVQMIEGTCFTC